MWWREMKRRTFLPVYLVVLTSLLAIYTSGQARPEVAYARETCTELTNNMVITQDTTFCAKPYRFPDKESDGVIIIGAHNIEVDGNGLTLDGMNKSGYGVYLNGYSGVTLRNFNIKRYYYAIRVENASNILVENNNVSSNQGTSEWFYDINLPLSSAYGGGILVNLTTNSTFNSNTGSGQNVGIDMYQSSGNKITNSNFSNNFGWGIRLYASTSNIVASNQANHVKGAWDTAGILLVPQRRTSQ